MRARDALSVALLGAALALSGCGGCGGDDAPVDDDAGVDADVVTFDECDSDPEAWVRNAYLAIVGHRPRGQAEVDVYLAIHDQAAQLVADGASTVDPKEAVARALAREAAFVPRWTSHFLDALRVPRADEQNMARCYADNAAPDPGTRYATYVRDNPATSTAAGAQFSMRDLVESSLRLDDVTPMYRGHLFALVSHPIPAANVPEIEAELARREDFGAVFDSAYLNRDLVCLMCHNSQLSVTDHPEPELDRHWPMAGLFEQALYGDSAGIDPARAHAMFRHSGFAAFGDGSRRPWGWSGECGSFYGGISDDPADVDGKFGGLTGQRLTVYELDAMMKAGFDALRGGALAPGGGGEIADPAHALAYLTSAAIVEGVWKEVVGSGLTIANYFPRNEASSRMLQGLTDRFIASGYSLQDLLVAIVTSDYFSRALPEEGCGDAPYLYPNVFDPWVISDADEARRHNGSGDAIAAVSARTLMRTAYAALEWPVPDLDFPGGGDGGFCSGLSCGQLEGACDQGFCCDTYEAQCTGGGGAADEKGFQTGVGAFIKNGERGFRGLDFAARLVWEDRFGACTMASASDDFVARIVAAAQADPAATVADVVVAIKDRLIGEPSIATAGTPPESEALAALLGGPLDRVASTVTDLEARARALCGVLLSSPQFVLSGAAGRGGDVPRLTPEAWRFDAVCEQVAPRFAAGEGGLTVTCAGDGTLTVAPAP